MLIPSQVKVRFFFGPSLSRRVNANSQRSRFDGEEPGKLIKKGEC